MSSGKMSVLSSIPTRFRVVLIGVACLGISLISQAQIVLNVSGGKGNTPLTINITTGASFTATGGNNTGSGFAAVIFNEFWDNTASSITASATTATVTFNGSSTASATGATVSPSVAQEDLLLGFNGPTISNGDTVVLTTGTRVTGNLSLNYTSINSGGDAFLIDSVGNAISDFTAVTWTTVPEPSTYAAISGLVCLGGAIGRRRFKRS